ncbi:hypothetical protein RJ55_03049 [Drechmeria coniospora]|nr:hypothetical protein RJ55_03049 [Drechmeria coniospora]
MEEDMRYNRIMIAPRRSPSRPPPYRSSSPGRADAGQIQELTLRSKGRRGSGSATAAHADMHRDGAEEGPEPLPDYWSAVSIEGVFAKKHEIEHTIKRAEDRHWHDVFVSLNGTALNVYNAKKDWGWGKTRDGPTISPDNPPWVRKSKLEKSYSLLHADAGIAADYDKRRYVIRIRAETDQFLLSCIELSTFVKWLECLFAAIDVAAPIDDRDFPRDMSIPRIQRVRWFQGQSPALPGYTATASAESDSQPPDRDSSSGVLARTTSRPSELSSEPDPSAAERLPQPSHPLPSTLAGQNEMRGPPRMERPRRMSTTTYSNVSIDPHTGKWFPEHRWSSAHDLLYAKLCYSNLLFRSPRKSNYIISKGKQWYVDWKTGKMVRVLPPNYGEIDYFGPWQVIHTENSRI